MGRIAAGMPIEAVETPETISLADFVQSKEVFVLQVRGESMQDEHIVDGDYVLVEKTKTAHNGDIVAALVDGSDSTLKRFYKEGDKIRLQPSNAAMKPIIVRQWPCSSRPSHRRNEEVRINLQLGRYACAPSPLRQENARLCAGVSAYRKSITPCAYRGSFSIVSFGT